jgi:flagellar biosynthesis protein FliR
VTVDLGLIAEDLGAWLWAGFLVFLRVGGMVALAPGFGEQSIPAGLRLAVALAFSLIVLPALAPNLPPQPPAFLALVALGGVEMLTGLFFGLLIRLFVLALQTAGTIAAQSAAIAQMAGAGGNIEPLPAIGHVLVLGGLTLALVLGLHVQLTAYVIGSYAIVPAGQVPLPAAVMEAGVAQVGRTFGLAFVLAAPFVAAALLYNVILGVISRAMPTLMITLVGAPALTLGALALLMLAAPTLLGVWSGALMAMLADPFAP